MTIAVERLKRLFCDQTESPENEMNSWTSSKNEQGSPKSCFCV